jgi:hypothetical protein
MVVLYRRMKMQNARKLSVPVLSNAKLNLLPVSGSAVMGVNGVNIRRPKL